MNWSLTLNTAPVAEPLATADLKAQMRVDHSDDDALIDSYALAARQLVELQTNRSLINSTWELCLDCFPSDGVIRLPRAKVSAVSKIEYVNTDGTTVELATTEYRKDLRSEPARITPEYSKLWPVTRSVTNAVIVTFTAGYGAAGTAVPGPLLQAMKLLVASWYKNRETVADKKLENLPRPIAFSSLIAPYTVEVAL